MVLVGVSGRASVQKYLHSTLFCTLLWRTRVTAAALAGGGGDVPVLDLLGQL